MSLLPEHDGIMCDWCKCEFRKQFEYYSYDFTKCRAVNNILPHVNGGLAVNKSFDLCPLCHEKISYLVISKYKPTRVGIVCDFLGRSFNGTFDYWYCIISYVSVIVGSKPVVNNRVLELTVCVDGYDDFVTNRLGI